MKGIIGKCSRNSLFIEIGNCLDIYLIRLKEESENAGLKLNIQKTKIMASSPITSWQIKRPKAEAVTDFIFLGSKITADSDYSHEIRRYLLFGRKTVENLDRVLKSRDIILPTKVSIVKTMVTPVVVYRSESQTIKNAERQRTNDFRLW